MPESTPWYQSLKDALSIPLFAWGDSAVTLWSVLYLLVFALLLVWISGVVRRVFTRALLRRGRVEPGAAQAVGTMVRYALVSIGLLIIVQTAGINLTTLNVIAGALGIGVGFGLQTIAANFISGLILLIGRPIKVGDRIEVGATDGAIVTGEVINIGARATTVLTNDNINIIIPNSRFVDEPVVNWSHNDRRVRFGIPVQVAYGSDIRLVQRLLVDVATADQNVLDDPAPAVRFIGFGESGIKLELRAWSASLMDRRGLLISRLNFAIHDAFVQHAVEIPFPQRVVHLRQAPSADRDAPS